MCLKTKPSLKLFPQQTAGQAPASWPIVTCLLVALLWLVGCDHPFLRNDLEAIKAKGRLTLITGPSSSSYYEADYGPAGFEYDLAKAFADDLGVALEVMVFEDEAEMVTALRHGQADIIAAGFPFGEQATRLLALGPGYMTVHPMLIGRQGGPWILDDADLDNKTIFIAPRSAHIELVKKLQRERDTLTWERVKQSTGESLLEMVWNQKIELAVVESNIVSMNRRFYPELILHMDLAPPRHLSWAMNPASRRLRHAVTRWFAKPQTQELIDRLQEHYFKHLDQFDYADLITFRRRIQTRLPEYEDHFKGASKMHDFDWQLIAAQAYQESHWDPRAVSFTGVRGIMMLTLETAKELGLTNRLTTKESIYAGTRYLARLRGMLDERILEPDRTFMALAAYNMGMGHVQDAISLASELGRSDTTWGGVRSVLPLLEEKKYYQNLRYGYARGSEAVQYVDRIRTYHKVLNKILDHQQQPDGQEIAAKN